MIQTRLKTNAALLQYTQLLVTHRHIVQSEQEYELITLYLLSLYLVKHRLSFLQQNQSLFVLLLGDEVECALIQLINHDWHLIFFKVEVFVVKLFE